MSVARSELESLLPPAATCRVSVGLAGRLDDWRPAIDLAPYQSGERLLAALAFARQYAPEFQQAFAGLLVVEGLFQRVGELVDNGLGRVFRGEQ